MTNIIRTGAIRGFTVPHSAGIPAVCAADISAAELEAAFERGLNARGALTPWALVLDRTSVWAQGMRPVIYADAAKADQHRAAAAAIHGRGWEALVVPTSVSQTPALRDDWTHEREWRMCFPADCTWPVTAVAAALRAVIVGTPGWEPVPVPALPADLSTGWPVTIQAPRWLWDAEGQQLVHDGVLTYQAA